MSQQKKRLSLGIIALPVIAAIIVAMISIAGSHSMRDSVSNALVLNDIVKVAVLVF
jgi:hypothetical protein